MKRIYANSSFSKRMTISTVVVVVAILFGVWELWTAMKSEPGGYGYLFAALFIGGGIYAMRQILSESLDMVVAVDADGAGDRAVISVWRPVVPKRIEGGLDRLANWRFEVKTPRANMRVPILRAEHPAHPRPLEFELGPGIALSDDLRALAPDAVAAFERSAR